MDTRRDRRERARTCADVSCVSATSFLVDPNFSTIWAIKGNLAVEFVDLGYWSGLQASHAPGRGVLLLSGVLVLLGLVASRTISVKRCKPRRPHSQSRHSSSARCWSELSATIWRHPARHRTSMELAYSYHLPISSASSNIYPAMG